MLYGSRPKSCSAKRSKSGRLYYCTSTGGYEDRIVELNDKLKNDSGETTDKTARDFARDVVGIIGGALGEGFFPAAPAKGECAWCDYRVVCGPHEEQRAQRKPAARLKELGRLREMP